MRAARVYLLVVEKYHKTISTYRRGVPLIFHPIVLIALAVTFPSNLFL
jgi:hypothetical protein